MLCKIWPGVLLYSMKIKEQTRKLAVGCSKHCVEVVDNLSGLDRHADLEDVVCKEADFLYDIRSDYQIADFHFYVLETPGHSAGGVSIVFPEDHLVLSGDALFRETIGRTDLPTGNATQLLSSIREELFTLPSSYTVYPGHGPETSIGHEKMFNPFFRQS